MTYKRTNRAETDTEFIRRLHRTLDLKVKDGGPTNDELVRGIRINLAAVLVGRLGPLTPPTSGRGVTFSRRLGREDRTFTTTVQEPLPGPGWTTELHVNNR